MDKWVSSWYTTASLVYQVWEFYKLSGMKRKNLIGKLLPYIYNGE